MVNGQFQFLGNIQHLQSKLGNGYSLAIKTNHDFNKQALLKRVNEFLLKNIKTFIIIFCYKQINNKKLFFIKFKQTIIKV